MVLVKDLHIIVLRLHVVERVGVYGELQCAVVVVKIYQRGIYYRRLVRERHLVLQHLQLLGLGLVGGVQRKDRVRDGHYEQYAPYGFEQNDPCGLHRRRYEYRGEKGVEQRYDDHFAEQP